jgi:hypothetical protein
VRGNAQKLLNSSANIEAVSKSKVRGSERGTLKLILGKIRS